MYIKIGEQTYPCTKRIVQKDTIKYLSVKPDPRPIVEAIQMYRDDGFLMSEDNANEFSRQEYSGTVLILTNQTAPETIPTEHVPTDGEVLNTLLGVV